MWSHRPAVFLFNHQSSIDPVLLMALLRRDVTAVAKKELAANPVVRLAGALADAVFIDRDDRAGCDRRDAPTGRGGARCAGKSLAVAPEGTRSGTGRLGPFKKGAFRLAMAGGVPVVPIVFRNANDVWPLGTQFMRPGTVDVVVHPPIPTDDWTDDDLDAAHRRRAPPLPRHARELAGAVTGRPARRCAPRSSAGPTVRGARRGDRRDTDRSVHDVTTELDADLQRDGGDARRSRRRRVPAHRAAVRPHRVPRPHPVDPSRSVRCRTSTGVTRSRCSRATARTSTRWCWRRCCSAPTCRRPTSSAASTWRSGRWVRWDAAAGLIFIRRSFRDDPVYKLALREYVGWLAEHRQNLEWYIEGGRTRTGKLRDPRLGLLAYLVDAVHDDRCDDFVLQPVSIVYDELLDVEEHARSAQGAAKAPESLARLVSYARGAAHPLLTRRHPRRRSAIRSRCATT